MRSRHSWTRGSISLEGDGARCQRHDAPLPGVLGGRSDVVVRKQQQNRPDAVELVLGKETASDLFDLHGGEATALVPFVGQADQNGGGDGLLRRSLQRLSDGLLLGQLEDVGIEEL